MSRKRRIFIFIGLWCALFITTLVVYRGLATHAEAAGPENSELAEYVRRATRVSLDGIPRQSEETITELDGERDHALLEALQEQIAEHNDRLYDCFRDSVSHSHVTTNYFEITFITNAQPNAAIFGFQIPDVISRRLSRVVLERSTIPVTSEEERCLQRTFEGFSVATNDDSPNRMSYVMCVKKRT